MTLIRRGSSTRERPFRTWVRAVATVVRHTPTAANDVGVDTAAANFGLLIVPRPITNRQQRTLCVQTRVSAMRATAAVTIGNRTGELHMCVVWISGVQIEVFICPAALRVMSTAELVITQAIDHFNGNTSSHVNERKY